jgi:hypothetical protein
MLKGYPLELEYEEPLEEESEAEQLDEKHESIEEGEEDDT